MKIAGRVVALVTMLVGALIGGWAPVFFETITGQRLPPTGDPNYLAIRAGVSFAFGFGILLMALGAVLWVALGEGGRIAVLKVLAGIGSLAALIVWSQAQAIWSTSVGYGLSGLLGCVVLTSLAALLIENAKFQPAGT